MLSDRQATQRYCTRHAAGTELAAAARIQALLGLVHRRHEASHTPDLSVQAVAVVGIGVIVESHRNLRGSAPFQAHGLREH